MTPRGGSTAPGDDHRSPIVLRAAEAGDVDLVHAIVQEAYTPYVEELGFEPGPLRADHAGQVAAGQVTLAAVAGRVAGLIVLSFDHSEPVIENVAVRPAVHGQGVGTTLLDHAEADALARGHATVVLYTHELMRRNVELYARRGYQRYAVDRLPDGPQLVHMRKALGPVVQP